MTIRSRGRRLQPERIGAALAEQLRATALLLDAAASSSADPTWRALVHVLDRAAAVLERPRQLPADARDAIAAIDRLIPPDDITPPR